MRSQVSIGSTARYTSSSNSTAQHKHNTAHTDSSSSDSAYNGGVGGFTSAAEEGFNTYLFMFFNRLTQPRMVDRAQVNLSDQKLDDPNE